MSKITVTEFRTSCLKIISRIAKTGEEVVITKNGAPIALLIPAPKKERTLISGFMKDEFSIEGDIVSSVLEAEDWEALSD